MTMTMTELNEPYRLTWTCRVCSQLVSTSICGHTTIVPIVCDCGASYTADVKGDVRVSVQLAGAKDAGPSEEHHLRSLGLVQWPECRSCVTDSAGYALTGESGTEVWLVVLPEYGEHRAGVRAICNTGWDVGVLAWSSISDGRLAEYVRNCMQTEVNGQGVRIRHQPAVLDAAVCIGSLNNVVWDCARGTTWQPGFHDLLPGGRQLFLGLRDLYGREPNLAVVIDT